MVFYTISLPRHELCTCRCILKDVGRNLEISLQFRNLHCSFWEVNIYVSCTAPQWCLWGGSLTLLCPFIGLLLWCLMQIGLPWIPMYLLVCTRNRTTLATQQFCLHSYEWKNLIKSHLPSLLTSALKTKIPSPYIEESFYSKITHCSKRRSACSLPEVLQARCCTNSSWRVFNHICHFLNPFP